MISAGSVECACKFGTAERIGKAPMTVGDVPLSLLSNPSGVCEDSVTGSLGSLEIGKSVEMAAGGDAFGQKGGGSLNPCFSIPKSRVVSGEDVLLSAEVLVAVHQEVDGVECTLTFSKDSLFRRAWF